MPFVKPMAKWRNLSMPTKSKYGYIYSNMFKITNDESSKMVREFYNSETFQNIKPFDDSVKAIKMLREEYDKIYIVILCKELWQLNISVERGFFL